MSVAQLTREFGGAILLCLLLRAASPARAATDDELIVYSRVQAEYDAADAAKKKKLNEQLLKAQEKKAKKEQEIADTYAAHGRLELIPEASKLRIRRTYADLLAIEGGNLGDFAPGQTKLLKDIKGALFSYSNDFRTDSDSWTAQAAVIYPLVFKTGVTPRGEFSIPLFGLMPSFTVNRFTTNRMPKDAADLAKIKDSEVDEMLFRVGSFAQLDFTGNFFAIARANGVWKTDTGVRSSEPGVELEFEPLWQSEKFPALGLGFLAIPEWAKKRPAFDDNDPKTYKHAWLGYQARLRTRFIWGSVEDDGAGKRGPEYSRAGLTTELNFQPFLLESLTATISASYLPALSGTVDRDEYISLGLGYTLFEDTDANRKVSLELNYVRGAQDNRGQKVQNQITVSVGVLY
jgi:hypothetical protein